MNSKKEFIINRVIDKCNRLYVRESSSDYIHDVVTYMDSQNYGYNNMNKYIKAYQKLLLQK